MNGSAQELYTYVLTHRQATVSLLTQIDCKSGASSQPPLTFAYTDVVTNRPASFRRESDCFLTQYFSHDCVSKRSKFVKDQYGDGLVCYPNFSTYGVIATRVNWKSRIPMYVRNAGNFQKQSYRFDTRTVCLTSRKDDRRNLEETFAYDGLNRLTQINHHAVTYAPNGNLTSMGGVGEMKYGNKERPYQLTDFYPVGNATMLREQQVKYTSFQCPAHITENGITASFEYKADDNRMRMTVKNSDATLLTRYYIGDCYEQDVETGVERLYLGGDAYSAPAMYVKERGSWKIYYICRDHLGSITHVVNEDGTVKQELSYDAWGRLRNPETQEAYAPGSEPILFLGRGYTGHEYLPWFGLVNMNARLYDPVLARFLSPDPYVQMPDDTQSYNRYSYCMNNPLKYVDKNGKSFLLIAAAFIGAYIGGVASNKGELNPCAWNWREETTYLGLT